MRPVGIFDSGVGGISVLKEAVRLLPNENYIYFGDTKNAPYGTKTEKEVEGFANAAVERLLTYNIKAVVIACNTATSAAAQKLRNRYSIPIIGMEPALKPASMLRQNGKILVMATPLTLSLPKYQSLVRQYGQDAVSLPCEGLMDYVETGNINDSKVETYLKTLFAPFLSQTIDALVLGCTHYVFLKKQIAKLLPSKTAIIDGNEGTVRQLERRLNEINEKSTSVTDGTITLITSGAEKIVLPIMHYLYQLP